MIDKYRTIIGKQGAFSDILDKVIYTYNNQVHRTIKATPNDMFKNIDKQNFNFEKDKQYNRNIISKSNISIGAEARILESKGQLEKGSQKFSVDLYKLVGREGNRFMVENSDGEKLRRRLKPAELQVVKTVEGKIDKNIIKEQAAEKKQRQTINKLVRNAEMTKQEALKAVEDLKTNDEPMKKRERKQIDYVKLSATVRREPKTKK